MQLEVSNIHKSFGNREVVKGISFTIPKGTILGLLGPNGSGKTTTIKMLTGQLEASAGQIEFDGVSIKTVGRKINSMIGVMPQEIIVVEHLSIEENLKFSAQMYNLSGAQAEQRTEFLIESLQLQKERKTLARHLSGGYRRRLNLAVSIVHDPAVIFLDEPTPGIDPQSRHAMWEFILRLKESGNYSILLTDHYLDEAEKVCDSIVIIDDGQVITSGSLAQLKSEHGNGKILQIDFENNHSSVTQFFNSFASKYDSAVLYQDRLSIPLANPATEIGKIIKELEDRKLQFSDLSIKEVSLEDIFLLLTGKEIRS